MINMCNLKVNGGPWYIYYGLALTSSLRITYCDVIADLNLLKRSLFSSISEALAWWSVSSLLVSSHLQLYEHCLNSRPITFFHTSMSVLYLTKGKLFHGKINSQLHQIINDVIETTHDDYKACASDLRDIRRDMTCYTHWQFKMEVFYIFQKRHVFCNNSSLNKHKFEYVFSALFSQMFCKSRDLLILSIFFLETREVIYFCVQYSGNMSFMTEAIVWEFHNISVSHGVSIERVTWSLWCVFLTLCTLYKAFSEFNYLIELYIHFLLYL